MKATQKILTEIGLISIISLIIYMKRRRRQKTNRINEQAAMQVAEHGYETAHDILFPVKSRVKRIIQYNTDFAS